MNPSTRGPGPPVAIAIGVIRCGDRFLVGVRGDGGPLAGYAEFPGGKCLSGESPEQCVVRECREETGIDVQIRGRRWEIDHEYPHGFLHLTFLEGVAEQAREPSPPFRWEPRQRLVELTFPPANRSVIADLLSEVSDA
jgi:8-oxo-dGTP diphosphatase